MQNFKPIYIYTQSLDNTSEDLMYEIVCQEKVVLHQITDLPKAQKIMADMNAVAIDKNNKSRLINKLSGFVHQFVNLDRDARHLLYIKGARMLVKIETHDRDNLGRHSPISIFLDMTDVKRGNTTEYVKYFRDGFMQFCQLTGRRPKRLDWIENLPLMYMAGALHKVTSSFIIGVIIIAIVVFMLNK